VGEAEFPKAKEESKRDVCFCKEENTKILLYYHNKKGSKSTYYFWWQET